MWLVVSLLFLQMGSAPGARADELRVNSVYMPDAPRWLKLARVNSIVERIQRYTEWNLGLVTVIWARDAAEYRKLLRTNDPVENMIAAFSVPARDRIVMGPKITSEDFDSVFGHELMHVVSYQHYRGAIPLWLEEGLANYIGQEKVVDYRWLAKQPVVEVKSMNHHPFSGKGPSVGYHYTASTALMEMIASRCNVKELLRLSVDDKLEEWLSSYCGIHDLDTEFAKWVKLKASGSSTR